MVSKEEWGNAVWDVFHTLTEKLISNEPNIIQKTFFFYKEICSILPCPECREHSTKLLGTININSVNTIEKLKNIMFDLHNRVNKKTGKKIYKMDVLDQYKIKDLNLVLIVFFKTLRKKTSIRNDMMIFRTKNDILKEFTNFLIKNRNSFIF